MTKGHVTFKDIEFLVKEAYIPFGDEKRALPWPTQLERLENDAEHSFSLALIGATVAEDLGLNAEKVASFATVHDLVEIFAGDTSAWDDIALQTKNVRENEGFKKLKLKFKQFAWIISLIDEYEALASEEARLVYALDKLLPVLMNIQGDGNFWKKSSISYEMYHQKYLKKRTEVSQHPLILSWYDEIDKYLLVNRKKYFTCQ
ncbi:MAG: HD domain-containing protein [Candidatus Saccharimonadales bacterium]